MGEACRSPSLPPGARRHGRVRPVTPDKRDALAFSSQIDEDAFEVRSKTHKEIGQIGREISVIAEDAHELAKGCRICRTPFQH